MGSLKRGFIISRFFSIYFTITGVKKSLVTPKTSLYIAPLYRVSTVLAPEVWACAEVKISRYALSLYRFSLLLLIGRVHTRDGKSVLVLIRAKKFAKKDFWFGGRGKISTSRLKSILSRNPTSFPSTSIRPRPQASGYF